MANIIDANKDYYKAQVKILTSELEHLRNQSILVERMWASWYDEHIVNNAILAKSVIDLFVKILTKNNTSETIETWEDTIEHAGMVLRGRLFWLKEPAYNGKTGVKLDTAKPVILENIGQEYGVVYVSVLTESGDTVLVHIADINWLGKNN